MNPAAVLALAASAAALPAGEGGAASLCGLCHPDVRVQYETSIHRSEEISCVSCHGGDPSAGDVAGAHGRGFRGRVRRAGIPDLCASCHADAGIMRPYNLPTDQLALYRTSAHGRLLARGDDRAAVCTDCHGAHDIRSARDPSSRVHSLNVPQTCARCHSDASLRAAFGHLGDPYADFAASVHGEALLRRGNLSAPDCSRCHGAHGAAPPGMGDVDKVCGQCHQTARYWFRTGPHATAMAREGMSECASCHGHHATAAAPVSLLETACSGCHAAGTAPLELASRMKTLYDGAGEEIETARALVDKAARVPLYVEDYRARLQEADTSLIESLPTMHSLDLSRVEHLTARARSIGREVQAEVNGKLGDRAWRRLGLAAFWFYLLVTVAILARRRRRWAGGGGR
ncbi:MAG TPA: cytochrome c3 family protein [Candidatus Polarisedimenticolia bacterium]|nr:cytochrome c3 family protein [Candidatus Polarisedimenticolia bacterium]